MLSSFGKRNVKVKNYSEYASDTSITISKSEYNKFNTSFVEGVRVNLEPYYQDFLKLETDKFKLKDKSLNVVLKIEKEGYLPNYVAFTRKKNRWMYADLPVPLAMYGLAAYVYYWEGFYAEVGFLIASGLMMQSFQYLLSKHYKFPKRITIPDQSFKKIETKPEDSKYLIVDNVRFNTDTIALKAYKNPRKYYKNKPKRRVKTERFSTGLKRVRSDEYFKLIPNERIINYELYKAKYLDTNNVVPDVFNTLAIEIGINKIEKHLLQNLSSYSFEVEWKLLDYRTRELIKKDTALIRTSLLFDYYKSYYQYTYDAFLPKIIDIVENEVSKIKKEVVEIDNDKEERLEMLSNQINALNMFDSYNSSVSIVTETGYCSGFFISSDGYVLTSLHKVIGKHDIRVINNDQNEYKAKLVRYSNKYDLALLKVEGNDFTPLKFNIERVADRGDDIYIIGATKIDTNYYQTLSNGILSAFRNENNVNYIQTDTKINDSTTGGPILDSNNNVIGIVNTKLFDFGVEGISFGVCSSEIEEALNLKFIR